MLNLLFSFVTPIYNDAPEPWQLGFQDGASPTHEGITELHDTIFFYLVIILFGVMWVLSSAIVNFNSNKSQIVYKYANHGTLIELIWTITPAFVLIAIAFPSFKLLYLMDAPTNYIGPIVANIISAILPIIKIPKSNCKELVVYGKFESTLGIKFNKYCLYATKCCKATISQLVGHLLGDGNLSISYTSITPYFIFSQTVKRFEYVWHVFTKLHHYCARVPNMNISFRNNTITSNCQVHTRSYPFLLVLQELFYKKSINGK
jgi:hypothetical protein